MQHILLYILELYIKYNPVKCPMYKKSLNVERSNSNIQNSQLHNTKL